MEDVREVLASIKLEQYAQALEDAGWDDAEHLQTLDPGALHALARDIGMKPGHTSKFVKRFAGHDFGNQPPRSFSTVSSTERSSNVQLMTHLKSASRAGSTASAASEGDEAERPCALGQGPRAAEAPVEEDAGGAAAAGARADLLGSPGRASGSTSKAVPQEPPDTERSTTSSRRPKTVYEDQSRPCSLSQDLASEDPVGLHTPLSSAPTSARVDRADFPAVFAPASPGRSFRQGRGDDRDILAASVVPPPDEYAMKQDSSPRRLRREARPFEGRRSDSGSPSPRKLHSPPEPRLPEASSLEASEEEPELYEMPLPKIGGSLRASFESCGERCVEAQGAVQSKCGESFPSYWYTALMQTDSFSSGGQEGGADPDGRRRPDSDFMRSLRWKVVIAVAIAVFVLLIVLGAKVVSLVSGGRTSDPDACCGDARARCFACQSRVSVASYCADSKASDSEAERTGCDDVCGESSKTSIEGATVEEQVFTKEGCCDACTADERCVSWHFGQDPGRPYREKYHNGHFPRCWVRRRTDDAVQVPLEVSTTRPAQPSTPFQAVTPVVLGAPSEQPSSPSARPPTLFCFSLMLPCPASSELLQLQVELNYSIFACDGHGVYSDSTADLGRGVSASVFTLDLTCPELGEEADVTVYMELWDHIAAQGHYAKYDWTVKVESDAVFFPERLRSALLEADAKSEDAGPPLPGPLGLFSQSRRLEAEQTGSAGTFVTSCRRQLHGPMEILSRDAVTKFAEERTQCEKRMALDTESDFLQSCLIQVGSLQLDVNSDVLASEECQTVHWKQCQSSHVAFALHADVPGYKACVVSATQVDGGRRLSR